jgi:hypothetical protein
MQSLVISYPYVLGDDGQILTHLPVLLSPKKPEGQDVTHA